MGVNPGKKRDGGGGGEGEDTKYFENSHIVYEYC